MRLEFRDHDEGSLGLVRKLGGTSRLVSRFGNDRSGGVAIIFALMTIVLCLFMGAAIDLGRWTHARQQTIAAMDAAVLAGGRILQLEPTNISGAIAAAQRYYTENTKQRLKLVSDTITFTAVENNTAFTATGNAFIATPLLTFVNIAKLPLLDQSGSDHSKSQVGIGTNGGGGVEIALMLDITGSMAGSKIVDAKAAAKDLVEIILGSPTNAGKAKISLVPFSEGVRLPTSANSVARGLPVVSKTVNLVCSMFGWVFACNQTVSLSPCVVERTGTKKYNDDAPGAGNYVMSLYDTSGSCALGSDAEVIPLTSDKTLLSNRITGLKESGGTAGQIGTAWAWYTLSPNWNSLWPADNQAKAYGTAGLSKVAILMTDGEYNTQYDSNGVATNVNPANDKSDKQARELCKEIKKSGITVYTIGFDLGGNQNATDTLNECASSANTAYNADNGEQLKQAFRDIGLKISQLYLTQ